MHDTCTIEQMSASGVACMHAYGYQMQSGWNVVVVFC